MTDYRTELGPVVYNAAQRTYEARVTFREGSERETYATSLHFPMDADLSVVAAALVRQAREMRKRSRVPFRSRLDARPMRPGLMERGLLRDRSLPTGDLPRSA